jgi:hypothetical protein
MMRSFRPKRPGLKLHGWPDLKNPQRPYFPVELGSVAGHLSARNFCLCLLAMPHTHEPDPASPDHGKLVCPACGKTMRLALAMPSPIYVNLDDCKFKCECGQEADYIIARE